MDYLKQKGPQSGQSAYEQITGLLLKLFKERPSQRRVYQEFEELTSQLRDITLPVGIRVPTERESRLSCYKHMQFAPKFPIEPQEEVDEAEPAEDAEDPEPEEGTEAPELVDVNTQNLQEIARILALKGAPFTQLDAFRLQQAINTTARKYELGEEELKLFGRVGPYWILRSTAAAPEDEEEEPEEEQEGDADGGEEQVENDEKVESEADDELRELQSRWEECKTQMEQDKEAEAAARGEQDGEEAAEAEAEVANGDAEDGADAEDALVDVEGAEDAGEPEQPEEVGNDVQANAEEAQEGEEEKQKEPSFHSEISLDEELRPETKIPKRLPVIAGKPYPLRKIKQIPPEEADGLNKYTLYAALDCDLNSLNEEIYERLWAEYKRIEFRSKNKLKQAKSRFSKLYKQILGAPLSFVPLPQITPAQVRSLATMPGYAVRFTGDLAAPVQSDLPPFEGTEAHLLKCVCVKLMHSYTVAPKRLFTAPEEDEPQEPQLVLDRLDAEAQRTIQKRLELLKQCQNKQIYEILLQDPKLGRYGEDEERLELTAAFPELDDGFKGYDTARELLNIDLWGYVYPRINGQGRCLEVGDDDYDGLDDPEPCELAVVRERARRKRVEIEREREQRNAAREAEKTEKRNELKKAKYDAWIEQMQERWQEEDDATTATLEELAEPQVEEDEFDDTEKPEKPDLAADTPYIDISKYYATRLWRKLRVFKRPVAPWDRSLIDNKPNVPLPDLLPHPGQLDHTRVDLKQKCPHALDEAATENTLRLDQTSVPLWSLEQLGDSVVALSSRCPGAYNIIHGSRWLKHDFLYFGNGIDQTQTEVAAPQLPEMCEFPPDLCEVDEASPELQRLEQELLRERARRAEERLRAEAKEEGEEKEEKEQG